MKLDEKKCPRCAEIVKKEAVVCKHCGHEFPVVAPPAADTKKNQNTAIGCLAVVGFVLAIGMCSSNNESGDEKANNSSATMVPSLTLAQAKELETKNSKEIKVQLAEAKSLPATDLSGNLRIYEKLVALAPANPTYVEKREQYKSRQQQAARYSDDPKSALEISKFSWEKGGFGSVQLVHLTVKNSAPFAIKDFELTCTHQGPSGTDMDRNVRTVYELVPANGSHRVREFNMGLIASQAASTNCEITGAVKA